VELHRYPGSGRHQNQKIYQQFHQEDEQTFFLGGKNLIHKEIKKFNPSIPISFIKVFNLQKTMILKNIINYGLCQPPFLTKTRPGLIINILTITRVRTGQCPVLT
jgi:hypothetical protein